MGCLVPVPWHWRDFIAAKFAFPFFHRSSPGLLAPTVAFQLETFELCFNDKLDFVNFVFDSNHGEK